MKIPKFQVRWKGLPHRMLRRTRDLVTEGWYIKGDIPSQDRFRLLRINYTANIAVNIIGGSFFTGLLLLLKADDAFIGNMTMISVAANMLQLFAPLILERFQKRRKILVTLRFLLYFLNTIFLGIIPMFPAASQSKLLLVAITVLLVNLINALISPGLTVWHIKSIPPNVRNSYYSIQTMTVGVVVAFANLIASRFVDALKVSGHEYTGLLTLRVIAIALIVVDSTMMWKIKEYPYEVSANKFGFKDLLLKPFKEKTYLMTVAVAMLWSFTANIPGPFYQVYLLKNLGVSYSYLMLVNLFNVPVVLLLTPIWSRILKRLSWFKTLYIAISLFLLHYIGLAFTTHATMAFYPISAIFSFVLAAGINLSFASIPYINIPESNQTMYIGFYSTMANFAALLGVTFGKTFIEMTNDITILLFGIQMINKQYILLIVGVLMGISVYLMMQIQKKLAKSGHSS